RETKFPRAVTTHAQTGEINAIGIHAIVGGDFIEQLKQRFIFPKLSCRTLRRDDDERKVCALFHMTERTVNRYAVDVVAALAGAVQKQHERPFFVGPLYVISGQVEQIIQLAAAGSLPFESSVCELRMGVHGGNKSERRNEQ